MSGILKIFAVLLFVTAASWASLSNVYIAQTAVGTKNGADCADALAASAFFNNAANWGSGGSQIGPGTVVHICGTLDSRSSGATLLTFYGDGASGSPVTLLFESGAIVQAAYCANSGCINLNGHSHIVIDGGTPCGKQGKATGADTPCNGIIQNTAVGSTGSTCIDGPCTPLGSTTGSSGIGASGGSPSDITVRNLNIKMYVRNTNDFSNSGTSTSGVGLFGGTTANHLEVHHNIFKGMGKAFVASLGGTSGTFSGYHVYNNSFSSQCWAMGVGIASSSTNITDLAFHDNEVQNWDAWAIANDTSNSYGQGGNVCHTNGTMWFNYGTPSGGFGYIGDSASGMWNNYLHGSLTGGFRGSSPSGMLSCQDNCVNVRVFNNVLHYTNVSGVGGGGMVYFNGPGGGGQGVYNNTMVSDVGGSCVVVTGNTAPTVIKNNIASGCGALIEIRPNCPSCAVSDHNDGYNINTWTVYNSAASGSFLSLATWRSSYGQDTNSVTTNPNLDTSYKPQTGSPAVNLGADLTSLGVTALDLDLLGTPRPSSAAWDAGAYQLGSGTGPAAPQALTALAR